MCYRLTLWGALLKNLAGPVKTHRPPRQLLALLCRSKTIIILPSASLQGSGWPGAGATPNGCLCDTGRIAVMGSALGAAVPHVVNSLIALAIAFGGASALGYAAATYFASAATEKRLARRLRRNGAYEPSAGGVALEPSADAEPRQRDYRRFHGNF